MNKKLSRSDYLLTFVLIFMLVLAVGSFLYGVKIGKERTEASYLQAMEVKQQANKPLAAYHQQYLVSFYHTIYLPYRDFQKKWFETMDSIQMDTTSEPEGLLKDLSHLASDQIKAMKKISLPSSSPLLLQAQKQYMTGLSLFIQGIDDVRGQAGSSGDAIAGSIDRNGDVRNAIRISLAAQSNYFKSIEKWHLSVDPLLKQTELVSRKTITPVQWATMAFTLKNEAMANFLLDKQYFVSFHPQDLTSRVDEMIRGGEAKELGLGSVQQIADTLVRTGAVRAGDYLHNKNKYYSNETMPQLPFFYE